MEKISWEEVFKYAVLLGLTLGIPLLCIFVPGRIIKYSFQMQNELKNYCMEKGGFPVFDSNNFSISDCKILEK